MANRIKGITIKIDGETTGLDKALKGVNSTIKTTQQELKDVTRLLKLDPSNTELVRQKQELLAKAVSETKTKLDTLKNAAKQMGDITENSTEQEIQQYNALQREIVDTEQKLKKLTTQQKEFSAQHSTLGQIGTKFQEIGGKIEAVGQKLAGLSAAAGVAVAAIAGITVKAASAADDLNTLAKQTGISTDELQKFQYASELIDVSLSDIAKGLARTTKAIGSNSSALSDLNIQTKNANGTFRKSEDVFFDIIDALNKMEDETQRDIYAQQLFGKSFQNLNPLIEDGTEALKALYEEAESSDLLLSQEEIDNANELNDSIDRLKGTWQLSMMKIGASMAENLEPVIDRVTEKIGNLSNWVAEHSGAAQTLAIVAAIVAVIAPLLIVIGKVIEAIGSIVGAFQWAWGLIAPILEILGATATSIGVVFGLVAIVIGTAIYAIVGVIIHWQEVVQNFKDEWKKFCDGCAKAFREFVEDVQSAWAWLTGETDAFATQTERRMERLSKNSYGYGADIMNGMKSGVDDNMGKLISSVETAMEAIRARIHFSRPDIGPMRDYEKWMPDMMIGLSKGITDNIWRIDDAISKVSGTMANGINGNVNVGSSSIDANSIYMAVRAGLADSNVNVNISERSFKRSLRGMGVSTN